MNLSSGIDLFLKWIRHSECYLPLVAFSEPNLVLVKRPPSLLAYSNRSTSKPVRPKCSSSRRLANWLGRFRRLFIILQREGNGHGSLNVHILCLLLYCDLCLCWQVILALGDYMNVQCHVCIGGTNIGEDIRKLDFGQHVVSGTPGRVFGKFFFMYACKFIFIYIRVASLGLLWSAINVILNAVTVTVSHLTDVWNLENIKKKTDEVIFHEEYWFSDMIRRRNLRTRNIKMLVLDEADEMLNKGWHRNETGLIESISRYNPCYF